MFIVDASLCEGCLPYQNGNTESKIFGDPTKNYYTKAILREITAQDHNVTAVTRTASDVMAMLEKIVVNEEAERLKGLGQKMTRR